MRVPSGSKRDELELKMTPMIDVVFLLLVFFLWTSSFEQPEFRMPSSLADPPATAGTRAASQTPVEEFDEIIVSLSNGNAGLAIRFNQQSVASIDELKQKLQAIIDLGIAPPLIVDPAEDVPMGSAIEVYDLSRRVGFDRVLFAARSDA